MFSELIWVKKNSLSESFCKGMIEKFEVDRIEITENSITLENNSDLKHDVTIDTYNDHRMAMSFAPLSLLVPININNPEVVTKSYLNFWDDLECLGFDILKNKWINT